MSQLPPKKALRDIGRKWPQAWHQVKHFRAGKGKDLPDWPDWCYLPIAAGVAIATQGDDSKITSAAFDLQYSPAVITAAAAWRISQGVYRFDAGLYNALISQPLDDNLPCEALKRLPEYCVYIETIPTSDMVKSGKPYIIGFWAHLEKDMNDGREELRFVFFWSDGRNLPLPVHLGDWTLDDGVARVIEEAKRQASGIGYTIPDDIHDTSDLVPYMQLVIYLCAENIDIPKPPIHPNTRVRMSGQIDVARTPKVWTVGERIGAGIRKYRNEEAQRENQAGTHASPRPHIRRAHWHHFWTGPRDGERKLVLRWLPPIPVGVEQQDGPVVIHKIK